jgi:YVTN family beta-propeller protein
VFGQYLEGVIDVGAYQYDVLCNPISNKIYTGNHYANTVTIIDGATRQIIATPSVPSFPHYLCLNTVSNRVYCLCQSNQLAIVNGVTNSARLLTIPHGGPSAIAYNAMSNRLYVGCGNEGTVVVVDGAADTILSELHLGSSPVSNMLWNPASNHLFCGNDYDSVFVLDCRTAEVSARWGIASAVWCFSPVTGRVYAGNSSYVSVLSPRGDSILATIDQGMSNLCAVPFPDKIYVCDHRVYVLDGSTNVLVDTIHVWGGAMVCEMVRGKVYVVQMGHLQVVVLDGRADTLLTTIPLPAGGPGGICRNPTDGRVYVADCWGDSVYVLRDTMPGIEETPSAKLRTPNAATIVRGVLWQGDRGQKTGDRAELLDVSGRKVLDLRSGANDVSDLAPGVYFVRAGSRGPSAGGCHKVVIQR